MLFRSGGEDNITVVLARFTGDDLQAPMEDRITVELPPLEEDKTLDETEADTNDPAEDPTLQG